MTAMAMGWSEPPPPTRVLQALDSIGKQWDTRQEANRKLGLRTPDASLTDLTTILTHVVRAARDSWGGQDSTLVALDTLYSSNGSSVLYAAAIFQYVVDKGPDGWIDRQIPASVAVVQAALNPVPRSR